MPVKSKHTGRQAVNTDLPLFICPRCRQKSKRLGDSMVARCETCNNSFAIIQQQQIQSLFRLIFDSMALSELPENDKLVVLAWARGKYLVPSDTVPNIRYLVNLNATPPWCTCDHYVKGKLGEAGMACKHIRYAIQKREEKKDES